MKKNGFTLAELLGVIIILAAVSLIAFPPIINQLKKSRSDLDDALNVVILSAAEQYLEDRNISYSNSNTYCFSLLALVDDGKLIEPIIDSNGNKVDVGRIFYIKIDGDGKKEKYGLVNSENDLDGSCNHKFH